MKEFDRNQLQEKLLIMLQWFDGFCKTNHLKYYAVGGTLLGAVRHKGFIPWDDDIDIAMPRDDYEKLTELLGDIHVDHYYLETVHSKDRKFCYPYSKLYDTETTLIENVRYKLCRGIFLDIFAFDGLGNDIAIAEKRFKSIQRSYLFYLSRMTGYREGRSLYKNIAIGLSRAIPNFILNDIKMRETIDNKCKYISYNDSEICANVLGNWGTKEIIKKRIIGSPTEYEFENIHIMGIEHYDEYLTHIYGNWRELPPPEKRVTHHDFIHIDLNSSYLLES